MAASDQTYRNQKTLDMVFGVSSVLMLISIIWMFAQDYNREWKTEQRAFRDVTEAMADRMALAKLPDPREYARAVYERDEAENLVKKKRKKERDAIAAKMDALRVEVVRSDERARNIKADLDSRRSFYDIEVEQHGRDSAKAQQYLEEIRDLEKRYTEAADKFEKNKKEMQDLLYQKDQIEKPWTLAKAKVKNLRENFDIQLKNAKEQRWKTNDWFRSLPILDAFNSPLRIQQYTLADLPIDYNFKYVTRFDRCTTCHQGIDRPTYDKATLRNLDKDPTGDRLYEVRYRIKLLQMTDLPDRLGEYLKEKNKKKPSTEKLDSLKKELQEAAKVLKGSGSWVQKRELAASLAELGTKIDSFIQRPQLSDYNDLKANISALKKTPLRTKEIDRQKKFEGTLRKLVDEIHKNFEPKKVSLSDARVNEFASHPRLDLFVGNTSAHNAEGFGCTICHGGQGSATDFFYASHTPNDTAVKKLWEKEHDWKANHDWEFPMWPMRFVESSCLKCHHQVTDLIREGNRNEAPKLLRGYNLVRENGCFGCHEISSIKSGNTVGPDLRLEPIPPLEDMSAEERAKATSDPLNMPGTMRKVGPSLYRISEKTHARWVRRWIKAPREFRPTTRMPHFYGLSNNSPGVLPKDQENFPDAEINGIAHYLFYESQGYLDNIDTARKWDYLTIVSKFRKYYEAQRETLRLRPKNKPLSDEETKQLDNIKKELERLTQFTRLLEGKVPADPRKREAWKNKELKKLKKQEKDLGLLRKTGPLFDSIDLNAQDKKELREAQRRIEIRGEPVTLAQKFAESRGQNKLPARADKKAIQNGRRLFTQKGCLACHSHQGVATAGDIQLPELEKPSVVNTVKAPLIERDKYFGDQPSFGPNLSMLREKLGTDETGDDYASKQQWLIQWIMEPTFHSARTLMPVTHLDFKDAADVAAWLLDQEPTQTGPKWDEVQVPAPKVETLKNLARESLRKFMADDDIDKLYKGEYKPDEVRGIPLDENELAGMIDQDNSPAGQQSALKWYIGRKAIGRLGCFGCHNIPGFDQAKPIGTPLNDWGKKDPDRLAFEDIIQYVRKHYNIVDRLTDKKGKPLKWKPLDGGKEKKGKEAVLNFERFFYDALTHHSREGFLQQKLNEPRSYDYDRLRAWDDRLRMPRFKFARVKRIGAESDEDFELRKKQSPNPDKLKQRPAETDAEFMARASVEEAKAREAVMTFILGLVAEPIPGRFVYSPDPERTAAIKGRQVIDKFNCAGCHHIQPGTYEFKLTEEVIKGLKELQLQNEGRTDPNEPKFATDYGNQGQRSYHFFAEHNAWHSQVPVPKDTLTVHGQPKRFYDDPNADESSPALITTEAFQYSDGKQVNEVRASGLVLLPMDARTKQVNPRLVTERSAPLGGSFADLLTEFLIKIHQDRSEYKPNNYRENEYARSGSPPTLFREGEKVQPNWLFDFLRHPEKVRPMARLRMPRFNMSDTEAMALVNYFAADAKRTNPGIGLTYPYAQVPQRQEDFLQDKTRQYVARYREKQGKQFQERMRELLTVWENEYGQREAALKQEVKNAQRDVDRLKKGTDAEKLKTAQDYLERVTEELKAHRQTNKTAYAKQQQANWEAREVYPVDGYRLLTNRETCLKCHQVGNLEASQAESQRGPPLHLVQDRLRADWVLRWVANPQRFLTYTSIMPQYFPAPKAGEAPPYQDLFVGSPFEQATAVRDVLMNFRKVADMPANRSGSGAPPAPAGGGE
jgi:cytochrome c peroxidase